jgi:hypothetical protein
MIPDRSAFTDKEWEVIERCRTPRRVQRFLHSLPYNHELHGETLRSFRGVVRHQTAHCLEAALAAATIMEQHGYPPLLLSFDSIDNLDHVVFLFTENGRYGAVARSRDPGLHGRKPVFKTVHQLAMSYYDPYVDYTGRIVGYAVINLYELGTYDWRLSTRNMWKVERFLIEWPHRRIKTSDRRYHQLQQRYHQFKQRYPDKKPVYYGNRHLWM